MYQNLLNNTLLKKKQRINHNLSIYLLYFIYLYVLFGLDRIKNLFSIEIKGVSTTNELWIIPLICLLLVYLNKKKQILFSHNQIFLLCIYVYILVIALGGFKATSVSQYLYAGLLFIIPMLIFFPASQFRPYEINSFFKVFVGVNLVYAIFAIILTTNYAYFMGLVGNNISDYYYSQYRASMMLGSSITVSYYLNLTLPICFYVFYKYNKKWKIIASLAIVFNIIATFVLLSRIAVLCAVLILLYYVFFVKTEKNDFFKKSTFFALVVVAIYYSFDNYDLSRVLSGFSFSGESESARFMVANLGLNIFLNNPLIGSGMGRFFERVYTNKYITVNDMTGLVDPHNMYILILSEIGIIGFLITITLFLVLFKRFSSIKDKVLRKTAYIILIAFLFDSIGGSQLINEISFSVIFWIYMGLFNAISLKG